MFRAFFSPSSEAGVQLRRGSSRLGMVSAPGCVCVGGRVGGCVGVCKYKLNVGQLGQEKTITKHNCKMCKMKGCGPLERGFQESI
jgi:hypothetical protein